MNALPSKLTVLDGKMDQVAKNRVMLCTQTQFRRLPRAEDLKKENAS
jgi:hypothetical protein